VAGDFFAIAAYWCWEPARSVLGARSLGASFLLVMVALVFGSCLAVFGLLWHLTPR
jgi:TRAP-type C4-dicarboxylate transport system permease small subunit